MPGEKRKKIAIIASIVLIFFIFLLSTRKEPAEVEKKFDLIGADMSYYEFVDEDTNCKDVCYTEYVVLSNGMTFAKKEIKLGEDRKAEVKLGLIDRAIAGNLISRTRDLMGGSSSAGINCNGCRLYHVFYGDRNETRAFSSEAGNAPDFMPRVGEMTSLALGGAGAIDPFFIHLVFEPQGANTIDYHFYSEGTVLREEFGRNNGDLVTSKIYTLNPDGLEIIKNLVTGEYFASGDGDLKNCSQKDLQWGYLEIQKGAAYKMAYTCGLGFSGADKLFNELISKVNGK